jgi:metal-responsive CopG/Arc/MetJ family transcriptional regulator
MKAVQMTLEEELVAAVDRAARKLKTTRSAFARNALRAALAKHQIEELERRHRLGYEKHPVRKGEFDVWHGEQCWGDG